MNIEQSKLYQLTNEIPYTEKGEKKNTATIEMFPPSMSTFAESSKLAQLVMRAVMSAQKNFDPDEATKRRAEKKDEDMDGDAVRVIVYSGDVSIGAISDAFIKLAVKTCKVSESIYLTPTLINKFDVDDYIALMCEYTAHFLLPSLLSTRE